MSVILSLSQLLDCYDVPGDQASDGRDLVGHLPDPVHGDGEALHQVGLHLHVAQHEGLLEPAM